MICFKKLMDNSALFIIFLRVWQWRLFVPRVTFELLDG